MRGREEKVSDDSNYLPRTLEENCKSSSILGTILISIDLLAIETFLGLPSFEASQDCDRSDRKEQYHAYKYSVH